MSMLRIVVSRTKDLEDLNHIYDGSLSAKSIRFSPLNLLTDVFKKFERLKGTRVRLSLLGVDTSSSDFGRADRRRSSQVQAKRLPRILDGDKDRLY